MAEIQKPSVGRTVHYVLPNGEHRPAVIVHVWDLATYKRNEVNLQVFTDGCNDAPTIPEERGANVIWRTSVPQHPDYAEGAPPAGTWHWPERL